MKKTILFQLILLLSLHTKSQNLQLETNWWQPNGKVNTMVKDTINNLLYVGGKFDYLGPNNPFASLINNKTNLPEINFPKPNGKVKAVISDGRGGWFLGGEFTKIGQSNRDRIAHINSLGQLSNLFDNGGFNNSVNALSLLNNVLYVGGKFNSYGESKSFGTIFNYNSEKIKTNVPAPNGVVKTSISDGNGGWFIAGDFTMIGDSIRTRIAHIDSLGQVKSTFGIGGFNSTVNTLVLKDQTLYIGGDFTSYGTIKKNGAVINLTDNSTADKFAEPNGNVRASIPDGQGGWYIAGEFTKIGNITRNYLAQLDSNGYVTNWSPNPDLPLTSLLLDNNILYVGGIFSSIDGQTRNKLAAFNTTTGNITSWNPNVGFEGVACMAAKSNILYIGGKFSTIGGNQRKNLGAIDMNTGLVTPLNISVDNAIADMTVNNNTLYIAGDFTSVGFTTRNYLAAIDIDLNTLTNWNPNPDGTVKSLAVKDSIVYITGQFYKIGATNAKHFAGINTTTAQANSLNIPIQNLVRTDDICLNGNNLFVSYKEEYTSNCYVSKLNLATRVFDEFKIPCSGTINTLSADSNNLYIGGSSILIGGQARNRLASFNLTNNELTNWMTYNMSEEGTGANNTVNAMVILGNNLYIGGDFSGVNKTNRMRLASINLNTGNLNAWNPSADGIVFALTASTNAVIIGGSFYKINNTTRNKIASVDTVQGVLTSWNPNANYDVYTLSFYQNTVYAGGMFSQIGGQNRNGIAALNINSGIATPWNPSSVAGLRALSFGIISNTIYVGSVVSSGNLGNVDAFSLINGSKLNYSIQADGGVYTIAANTNAIYVGGKFLNIGVKLANTVAAINIQNGELYSLPINIDGEVLTIATNNTSILVGGDFMWVNGINIRRNIASFSISDGSLQNWNPSANDVVFTIALNGNNAYVGGRFSNIGGQPRSSLAAISLTTGNATNWNPSANNTVFCIAINNGVLYAGGDFSRIGGLDLNFIAALNLSTAQAINWNALADGKIYTIALTNTRAYVGGAFNYIYGVKRKSIATFDLANNRNLIGNYSATDTVLCIAATDDKLFAGGVFNSIGGEIRENLAVFNYNTGLLTNRKLVNLGGSSSKQIKVLVLKNQNLYIGGSFNGVNNISCENICSINLQNDITTGWPYYINGDVNTMVINNNNLYVGGAFTGINSSTQNRLAAFDVTTGSKLAWNPNANNDVLDMVIDNNKLYVGGKFTSIGNQNRTALASFDLSNESLNSWTANADAPVRTLKIIKNNLFIGGDFTNIKGSNRNKMASINLTNGLVSNWNLSVNGSVSSIDFNDSTIYVGGDFNQINSKTRGKIAAFNLFSGSLLDWSPDLTSGVSSILASEKELFIGREYSDTNDKLSVFSKICSNPTNNLILTFDSLNICEGNTATLYSNSPINSTYQWFLNDNAIQNANDSILTINNTGTYSLLLTNSNLCKNVSNKITFNFSPKPIIYDILSSAQPVNNSQVTYSVSENIGSNYKWILNTKVQDSVSKNSLVVQWKNLGTNQIQLLETNKLGCISDTAVKTVQVIPETLKFTADTIRFNTATFVKTLLFTTNTTWTASALDSWLTLSTTSGRGNGASNITVQSNTSGKSRTSYINVIAGSLNKSVVIIQEAPVGIIENNPNLLGITIHPNPNNGHFIVSNHISASNTQLSITDLLGKIVYEKNYENTEEVIINHNLKAGIYFVSIVSDIGNKTIKIVVE